MADLSNLSLISNFLSEYHRIPPHYTTFTTLCLLLVLLLLLQVLGRYIYCMKSTSHDNGIKEPSRDYLNCSADKVLVFGGKA